jgi:acid stress-induced BolA-like protein IbaG/YrbA
MLRIERSVVQGLAGLADREATEDWLKHRFDDLESAVTGHRRHQKIVIVSEMLHEAYRLARHLYEQTDEYQGADVD